ncbi:Fc.00g077970.m01.CDS01 [Cosmosporella sp. VM-42]
MKPMSQADSLELFRKVLGDKESNDMETNSLLDPLQGLPLAICHIAGYLKVSGTSLADLLQDTRSGQNAEFPALTSYQQTMDTAIKIELTKLSQENPLALECLTNACAFEPDSIPLKLLGDDLPKLGEALTTLRRRALIDEPEVGFISINRILQGRIRNLLKERQEWEPCLTRATFRLHKAFPFPVLSNKADLMQLLSHAMFIVNFQEDLTQREVMWNLLVNVVRGCETLGDYQSAESMLRKVYQLAMDAHGPSRLLIDSAATLARVLTKQERYQEAELMHQQALVLSEEILGADHRTTIHQLTDLAIVLHRRGKHQESESKYWQLLKLRMSHFENLNTALRNEQINEQNLDTAILNGQINGLAIAVRKQGEHKVANALSTIFLEKKMAGRSSGGDARIALSFAAKRGHTDLMKLLLTRVAGICPDDFQASDDFEGSASSSDDDDGDCSSLFSVAMSVQSNTTSGSMLEEINVLLVQEFADLLKQDQVLMRLVSTAVSNQRIGLEKMRAHFQKLLKHYAIGFKTETPQHAHQRQRDLVRFLSSFSTSITRTFFSDPALRAANAQAFGLERTSKNAEDRQQLAERYLRTSSGASKSTEAAEPNNPAIAEQEDGSDKDSSSEEGPEEGPEEEPYEGTLEHLAEMRRLIVDSTAYKTLHRRLHDFVHPSCKKFGHRLFVPGTKDHFPDVSHPDYEYQPKPPDDIPPVTEHEFMVGFYACFQPRRYLHWYHECTQLGAHDFDYITSLPKKLSDLEEEGNQKEFFWAIYARERIFASWLIGWIIIILSPSLAFIACWLLPLGYETDLQNASVPFSATLGMASIFFALLHIGKLS